MGYELSVDFLAQGQSWSATWGHASRAHMPIRGTTSETGYAFQTVRAGLTKTSVSLLKGFFRTQEGVFRVSTYNEKGIFDNLMLFVM